MICGAIAVVVLLVLAWFGGAAWAACRPRREDEASAELLRARREAQTYREDALRWKYRALRRGWKPGQAWKNR